MNLHAVVSGAIGAVNPSVQATIQRSTGSTTNPDFSRTPTFSTQPVSAQVQALTYRDLQQIDGLNLNGTRRAIYLSGELNGTVRVNAQGGDLIILTDGPNAGTWLVAQVLEQWENWVKVVVTLQDGS